MNLARVDRRKSQILPVYVLEVDRAYALSDHLPQESSRADACVDEAQAAVKKAKVSCETVILHARHAGPAIVREALEQRVDLVVLGVSHANTVHSSGAQTALARGAGAAIDLGHTADYILSHAHCEVIVVREPPKPGRTPLPGRHGQAPRSQ